MKDGGLTHWADILTIVLYFVFVLAVGTWSIVRRKKGNVESYFLAGRAMPWFAVGLSIFGSNIGSEHFIGLAGSGAANGMVFILFEWIPALIIQFMSWFYLPVFISAGVYTLPEYMERRFGRSRLRLYLSVLALFLHIVNRLSATIFSGAVYIQLAFRWNMYPSIVGILLITGIFTILGGLTAVMYTDTAQSVIMVIGAFVVMGLSLNKIGGMGNIEEAYSQALAVNVTQNATCGAPRADAFHVLRAMDADFPWPTMLIQAGVASAWYWICDQIMVQRCLAARNISHAKGGTLLGGFLKLLPLYIMIVPGMISRILYPDEIACADADSCLAACDNAAGCSNIAYPKLVLELLPRGARGLIMAVMLSAIVTSLTSIFNSSSTVFTMDVWRHFRPAAQQRELLLVGRLYIVVLCGLTVLWIPVVKAAQGGQLFQYIVVIEGFIAAPLPILFALVVFWDRTTEQGAFYGLLVTNMIGLARFALEAGYPVPHCGEPDTRPAFLSKVHSFYYSEMIMLAQFLLTVGISLCTRPVAREKIKGTTWSTRLRPFSDRTRESGDDLSSADDVSADTPTLGYKDDMGNSDETNRTTLIDCQDLELDQSEPAVGKLRRFYQHLCGVREGDDDISVEISVKSRRSFLRETSKRVVVMNNAFAIILVASICFVIGKYA